MQIFIGCSLYCVDGTATTDNKNLHRTMLFAEIALSVVITIVMGYYATKLVKEKLAEIEEEKKGGSSESTPEEQSSDVTVNVDSR